MFTKRAQALSTNIAVGTVCFAAGALLTAAQRDGAQGLRHGDGTAGAGADRTAAKTKATAAKPAVKPRAAAKPDSAGPGGRRPVTYYTATVRKTLFEPPQPPPPPKPKPAPRPRPVPRPVIVPIVPVATVDPFADWSYTGTIHMGGRTIALVENTKSHEGQYLEAGGNFLGATVAGVTDQMLTLTSAGQPHMLAKADVAKLTPLDANAPFLGGGQPNPSVPPSGGPQPNGPQPGGPPPGAMPPGMPNGVQVVAPMGVRVMRMRATGAMPAPPKP